MLVRRYFDRNGDLAVVCWCCGADAGTADKNQLNHCPYVVITGQSLSDQPEVATQTS